MGRVPQNAPAQRHVQLVEDRRIVEIMEVVIHIVKVGRYPHSRFHGHARRGHHAPPTLPPPPVRAVLVVLVLHDGRQDRRDARVADDRPQDHAEARQKLLGVRVQRYAPEAHRAARVDGPVEGHEPPIIHGGVGDAQGRVRGVRLADPDVRGVLALLPTVLAAPEALVGVPAPRPVMFRISKRPERELI